MFIRTNDSSVLVALEVGTSKVAAAVAKLQQDGTMVLLGVGEVPSSGVRKGEIAEFHDAQTCVRQALKDAEEKTDAIIEEVYLLLTGSHVESKSDFVRIVNMEEDYLVNQEHVEELNQMVQNLVIPRDRVIVHSLLQHYRLDNEVQTRDPIGQNSQTIEAHFHRIHGVNTRLQTTVRCVRELDIEISGYALSSYATAQVILPPEAKQAGCVAIDLGAGVSDYIVYRNGAVVHTGALGLGGDHLTQDLAIGLRLPYAKAEYLKKRHGNLFMDGMHPDDRIQLPRDMSFEERHIYRDSMVKILAARQSEILEIIEKDIGMEGHWPHLTGGVYITGGASQMQGLGRMAGEVFPVPVEMVHEHQFDGDQTYSKRPDLSSLIGLLRYAQFREMHKPKPRGWRRIRQSIGKLLASMNLF